MRLDEIPFGAGELFPAGDYALHMRFRRGSIEEFFSNRGERETLAERARCVQEFPNRAVFLDERAGDVFNETLALARAVGVESCANISDLAAGWEPDLLLLRPNGSGEMELVAAAVCFPSSWAPEEKFGRPLSFIHAPVPALNQQLGAPVRQFLERIKPGISWERINWGLSRSPELNQHPKRELPRLHPKVALDEVWFRAEYQSLVALPESGGVLFGIRIAVEPLAELLDQPAMREGLLRALRTMPEEMARYKGLASARAKIVRMIEQ